MDDATKYRSAGASMPYMLYSSSSIRSDRGTLTAGANTSCFEFATQVEVRRESGVFRDGRSKVMPPLAVCSLCHYLQTRTSS